jgi:stage V sporulation protein B
MGSLGEAAAASARGSFIVFVGSSVARLVSAAGMIIVARLLSPSDYGLYGVSLVLPGLFSLFSDWGVNSALIRFIARYESEGEAEKIRVLEEAGFLFKLAVGCVLSLALLLSADILAAVFLRRPEAGGLVKAASLLILFQSLYNTVISVLTSLDRMDGRAVVTVFQAMVKGVCSPFLVYFGFGVYGAIVGHVLSYSVAAAVGFLLTLPSMLKLERPGGSANFRDSLGLMLEFGLPLFFGGLIARFVTQLRGLLLSWFVSYEAIGNYHVASRFVSLVGIVTSSIGVVLYPTFSKFSHSEEPEKTREVFQSSVRYSAMVVLPLTAMLASLSNPAVYFLFTAKYPHAPLFFSFLLAPMLLVGLGSLSIGNFLNSQGDTGTNMKVGFSGSALAILLYPVFVWMFGVEGLIIGIIISSLTRNLFGLYVLRRKYGIYPDLRHTGKTVLCSAVSAVSAYGAVQILSSSPLLSLFLGSATFLTAYLLLAPVTGAIEGRDIENLDSMLRELWVIYPFARLILKLEEKILGLMHRRQSRNS